MTKEVLGRKLLANLKLYSDYLKWDNNKGRYETWNEACENVLETHIKKYGEKIRPYLNEVLPYYQNQIVLASQRNLQFRGEQILRHESRMYNCLTTYCYTPDVFEKSFYQLLCGCGLGVSLRNKFVGQLPKINKRGNKGTKTFVIPDSIEGWAKSVHVLLSSYCKHLSLSDDYFGYDIKFDYSQIRPKGSYVSGGFKAPGYEGLKQSLERIENLLEQELSNKDSIDFRSIIAYDIFMHISDAVLSGGVRRCLPENSKVFLKNGVKDIQDVKKYDEVLTPYGYKKVLNNFYQGEQKLLRINTEDGYFRCTSNHKMAILNGYEEYEWKMAKDIKENDRLILNSYSIEGTKTKLPDYNYVRPEKSTTCKDINIPELDEKMAWFIGFFHGDGYVYYNFNRNKTDNQSNNVLAFKTDKKEIEIIKKAKQQLERFGVNTLFKESKGENTYRVRATSKQLAEYFYLNIKQPNQSIEIPEFIWNANYNIKLAYVSGLFDADGAANNRPVNICTTVYRKYVYDLQSLLYSCGILTRVREEKNENVSSRKDNWQDIYRLNLINKGDKNKIKNSKELVKNINITEGIKNVNKIPLNFIRNSGHFVGYKVKMFNEKGVTVDKMENYGFDINLKPCRVIGIEDDAIEKTYDIEVESVNQFYCNGYLTHNSAMLCLMDHDDKELMYAKTGNWRQNYPWRARSNNSDGLIRNKFTKEEFNEVLELNTGDNDIGFIYCNNENEVMNPCGEIGFNFYNQIEDYNYAAFQGCNLNEIIAPNLVDKNGNFSEKLFYESCREAAILGTLQAGYTNFPNINKQTEEIFAGEALLGVSITGWMQRPELFNEGILKRGAEIVKETNKEVSDFIGINYSARTTCVKPSGNSSVITQIGASGITPDHSKRGFRVMQQNKNSEIGRYLYDNLNFMIEDSVWSSTNSDYVVFAPYENEKQAIYKSEMQGVKHLEYIKLVQNSWVRNGKNTEYCYNSYVTHNVSNTVIIDNHEEISNYLYKNQDYFAAVSFVSEFSDKDYNQSPFTSVLNTEELLEKYGEGVIFASGLIVDGLHYYGDLWEGTNVLKNKLDDKLEGSRDQVLLKKDWLRRARKFAKNYFKNDIDKMIYCLKDVHLWHKFNSINMRLRKIPDFSKVLTQPEYNDINQMGAIACSGGQCEI